MRELVRQCGVLDFKYAPAMWIGDRKNGSAKRFIHEMNEDLKLPDSSHKHRRRFSLTSTSLLDMERPYLREIEEGAEVELELGEFPSVEALAFAALEGKEHTEGMTLEEIHELQRKHGLCD